MSQLNQTQQEKAVLEQLVIEYTAVPNRARHERAFGMPRRTRMITRTLGTLIAAICVLGVAPKLHASEVEEKQCSNATLRGEFSFTTTGTLNGVAFASVGKLIFDGQGAFQSIGTVSNNGVISEKVPVTGTYSVNADCTGSSMVSTGRALDFVIVDNANEIQSINTASGTVLITVLKRLFPNR